MKIWTSYGKRQKVRDYRLHKTFILDETSKIYKEINYCINAKEDFIANLGHSTMLFQYKGIKILTDPFLSPHIFGIRRQKPALNPNILPKVDFILISHAHYDHLDMRTLRRLKRNATLVIPENVKPVIGRTHFRNIIEMKVGEKYTEQNVKITALPVKHNKGRSMLFPNTGVQSYHIQIEDKTFYFGGDSAYFEGYKEIGKNYHIDVAFLPIGGYEPTLLLKNVHMSPWEAIQSFEDLNAGYIVPMHYGTYHSVPKFVKVEAPLQYFKEEMKRKKIEDKAIIVEPNQIQTNLKI